MIKSIVVTLNLSLLLCFIAVAQENRKAQEPEYDNVFHYLDAANNTLIPLERRSPNIAFKTKAMGFGGGKTVFEIKGGKSPIRFKSGDKTEFVVRGYFGNADPAEIIKFVRLDAKKDMRELLVTRVGAMGTSAKTVNPDEGAIPFNAIKYGQDSRRIIPTQALPAGEYGLSVYGFTTMFCFGVDPIEK